VLIWEILNYGELPFKEIGNADVQRHVLGGNRLTCPNGSCPNNGRLVAEHNGNGGDCTADSTACNGRVFTLSSGRN
jgi:hypothetical protein